jgi:hypothetical protein
VSDRRLELETRAANRIRQTLVAAYGDDTDLIRDVIEGETSVREALAAVAETLQSVEGDIEGIEIVMAKQAARKARYVRYRDGLREALACGMEVAEITSLKTPVATLSMRATPPSVEIIDQSVIPPAFMRVADPSPDKRAILAAIKDGATVPGCVLSNQPPALSVRTS